jgi:SAM-dependent methyltransferase
MSRPEKEWWEELFDQKYIDTYVDIVTPELTAKQISFLLQWVLLKKGAEILDLACGYGRHAIELARRGYKVTGLDFSRHFIELAEKYAKEQGVTAKFVQDDMRNLSFVNRFEAVISMFTSFGYFDDERDNGVVLREIARALKSGGKFVIDLNNAMYTLARMAREGLADKKTGVLASSRIDSLSNGLIVSTRYEFNPATMRWSTARTWREMDAERNYRTQVRLYLLPELRNLMEQAGLRVQQVWGDFDGSPLGFDSHRLIVLADKS